MAQQQIITKPYVGELQDDDSLFINHDGALRQVKKKDVDFASSEYVRTYVDNATVASAQKATNDSDGNAINTTYRKVADSYSKTEIDTKLDNATVADSYSKTEIDTKLTGKADKATSLSGYGITDAYTKTQTDDLLAKKASASHTHTKSQITDMPTKLSQFTNDKGFKKITWSTITIATSAWSDKTATVSISGVTADNAVDVAPVEPTFDAYINAGIRATSQGSGTLTFTCKTVPTVAISVNVKVYN